MLERASKGGEDGGVRVFQERLEYNAQFPSDASKQSLIQRHLRGKIAHAVDAETSSVDRATLQGLRFKSF